MSYVPSDCSDNAITCENSHLTLEQLFRDVLTFDENGCLVLRTSSTGGGGAGDASAANQITEIARLTSILGQLDITQTAAIDLLRGASTKDLTTIEALLDARFGTLTETAPATDTASSGLNGRLQRIAQRITSLITLIPTSLGQKTMANSFAVTFASDQSSIPAYQVASAVDSGATNFLISNANDTGQVLKSSAGNLLKYNILNRSGDAIFVKFYNKASAPTAADTPIWIHSVPAGIGSQKDDEYFVPIWFSIGISVRCVTSPEHASTASPLTNSPFIGGTYR